MAFNGHIGKLPYSALLATRNAGYVHPVVWVALVLILGLMVGMAVCGWYAAHLSLVAPPLARLRRVMRWTTVGSVGIGVAILVAGLVASALTGYWLILLPTWSFGLLHINFAVRAWLRWTRRSGTAQ